MANFKTSQKYNGETNLEEIEIYVPKNEFDVYFDDALERVRKTTSAPGFRKGQVPKNVVLTNKYSQVADLALELIITETIKNLGEISPRPLEPFAVKSIDPISQDPDSDLKVTLTYLPMPTTKIADLTKIKVKKPESKKTTPEEVEKELGNVWFSYAQKLNPETKKEDFKKDLLTAEFLEKSGIAAENPDMKTGEDLEKFIETYINQTYEQSAQIDWDESIKTELVQSSIFDKIEALILRELDKRVENYLGKFKEIGVDPEEYLKKNNVNLDDLKKEWRIQAERDVKFELILQEYGKQKDIKPTEEEIEAELSRLDQNTKKFYDNDEERLKSLINYYYINNKAYTSLFNEIREENK